MSVEARRVFTFLFWPRTVIRDLVGSRPWRVVGAISLMMGAATGLLFLQAPLHEIPENERLLVKAFAFVGPVVMGYGVLSLNGLLRARAGRELGGRASAGELSAALAWSLIPVWSVFLLVTILIAAMSRNSVTNPDDANRLIGLWYFLMAVMLICFVWCYLLGRSSVLELQGFTAAQGRAAAWKGTTIYMRWLVLFTIGIIALSLISRLFMKIFG